MCNTNNTKKKSLILLSLMLFILAEAVLAADVGKVVRLEGKADVTRGLEKARVLHLGDTIQDKDILRTKSESLLQVKMVDGSRLTLDENTRVIVQDYITKGEPKGLLELTRGRLRTFVTDLFSSRKDSFKVKTRTAVVGVQGTDFELHMTALETMIFVYSGIVSVSNISPKVPGVKILRKGQSATVKGNQPPITLDITTGVEGVEPAPIAADIGSGSRQDLTTGGKQVLDPSTALPIVQDLVPLTRDPNTPN